MEKTRHTVRRRSGGDDLKYFSVFSGIGGIERGIQNACNKKFRIKDGKKGSLRRRDIPSTSSESLQRQYPACVGYSEIDKYAIQIYKRHFGGHKNYGNARDILTRDIPDFDFLVGGFPCQAFSIAGKRQGFDDTRGTLFFEIARILRNKRPRRFLLENVKGLLSHESGKTFQTILKILSDIGYRVEWQVLNSKNFGVPQNRERVFIVGHIRGTSRPEVFPIRESNQKFIREDVEIIEDSARHTPRTYKGIFPAVQSSFGMGGGHVPLIKPCIPVLTPDRPEKRQNGRRFKKNGDPAFTHTAQDRHGIYDGARIRRLTPTECERLQGFPDGWTDGISDTQRYKCLGNAVTVNVIQAIMEKML